MTGCFVNIRGVEHPDKQRFLRETIREEGVCFIGLCETIKSNYTPNWLKKIAGNRNFAWESVPPVGRSGGILLGVDTDYHEILETETGEHFIRMKLSDRMSRLGWNLIVVYGPAQLEDKESFLEEFAQLCNRCKGAAVIGGDFNIIRKTSEKNKPCILPRWSHIFNSIIDVNGLKEIRLLGRQFTWANNLPDPTFEKLDRVLVTAEWDQAFPLAVVTGMNRDISDHVPLLLKYGATPPHSNSFRYENCWMEREGFVDIVKETWNSVTFHRHDIDKWQEKVRRLRRHIKG
jgi:mannosylglycoprotein endo-beta-mannosidase